MVTHKRIALLEQSEASREKSMLLSQFYNYCGVTINPAEQSSAEDGSDELQCVASLQDLLAAGRSPSVLF